MGEFELIKQFFTPDGYRDDVLLGVGDDAAVVRVDPDHRLVTAVDTLVAGVHFPLNTDPFAIGWRALAVNLSDLAAMGAIPRWFTLSLTLPQAEAAWLQAFAEGLLCLARMHDIQLVGGDTVKGPLNISVQVLGEVERDRWLTRSGAKPGDFIFVSGVPGEAAGGLQVIMKSLATQTAAKQLTDRFLKPEPRVALGRALRMIASAAMDVSDGLLTDLHKLCKASGCGAQLNLEWLPVSASLPEVFGAEQAERLALYGGDDYELLFTMPPARLVEIDVVSRQLGVSCTRIGTVTAGSEVICLRGGAPVAMPVQGYDHFAV